MDIVNGLPGEYVFLNYLRCHDDIGWGLDYQTLQSYGMNEVEHKKYLNDYFRGLRGASNSRGELYNDDPVTGDARFCGTTASMCGLEKAESEQDEEGTKRAIRLILTLHAYMFMQSGIPVLYSGDEIGQKNDYSYKNNPDTAQDSRYVHRGAMRWNLAEKIKEKGSVQDRIFNGLSRLEHLRRKEKAFVSKADAKTVETGDRGVLAIERKLEGDWLLGIFNFTESDRNVCVEELERGFSDLLTGVEIRDRNLCVPACGFYYFKRVDEKQR